MRILILTTKTDHHLYFINQIKKKHKDLFVITENKKNVFKFRTYHKYFRGRSKFEKKFFFNNNKQKFFVNKSVYDVNNYNSIDYIKKINPDIILLFGIGLLNKNFLKIFKKKQIVNLHGGDPENYRGLDSLLWSLYHKDLPGISTTLHYVNEKYDTGNIIFKKQIKISSKISIYSLRAYNTVNCVKLFEKFVSYLKNKRKIITLKQKKIGRYYSAIPSYLIDVSIENLKKLKKKNEK